MRSVYLCVISIMMAMAPIHSLAAQQFSSRMSDVLAQEGQIEDFVFSSSQSPVFVTIGADSRKDRQTILAACQSVLEEKWQPVENQYGYAEALLKNKNALATVTAMLTKARRGQQGLDDLQSLYWQFENDYNGSGRMLECMLGKALAMAGGTTSKTGVTSVPDVAGLGSNSQQVLLHIRKSRFSDSEVRRDHRAILRQCENLLDASFAHHVSAGQDFSAAASSADYPLSIAAGKLYRARRSGNSKELDDELRSMEVWARNNPYIGNQLNLCFHRAAKSLVTGGAAPTVVATSASPLPAVLSGAQRRAAIERFNAEFLAFRERYPIVTAWTDAEKDQYRVFMGTNALAMLDRYKANMTKEEYDTIAKPGIELRDMGRAGCPACKVEYPLRKMVAGLDTPSASFQPQYKAAQENYASNAELESTMQQLANKASNPSGTITGAFAGALTNAGKPALVHNRANDATACIRVEPTGAQMEWGIEGRYRLRNNCGYPIAASWCANAQECGAGRGNLWTIAPGKDWPIYFADVANPNIQVGACKAGDARQPPLGQQGVERTGFNAGRDTPAPAPGVSLLTRHRCD